MIAIQLISRLQYLHYYNYIHRDIKPENCLIGLGEKSNIIHLIDFGLSKRYRSGKTKLHIPFRDNREMNGTIRYASLNTHMGIEQSRRDDLESLSYMLIYLLKGTLPWQNLKTKNKAERLEQVMELKQSLSYPSLLKEFPGVLK